MVLMVMFVQWPEILMQTFSCCSMNCQRFLIRCFQREIRISIGSVSLSSSNLMIISALIIIGIQKNIFVLMIHGPVPDSESLFHVSSKEAEMISLIGREDAYFPQDNLFVEISWERNWFSLIATRIYISCLIFASSESHVTVVLGRECARSRC